MIGASKAIIWWEKRRILFNLAVLITGLVTIALVETIGSNYVKPGEDVEEPLGLILAVILYAIAANACYTLGWITELLWQTGDSTQIEAKRRKLFRLGMIFSIGLTLSPAVLLPMFWAAFGAY